MLKSCLGDRNNTPSEVLIKTGFVSLKAVILTRQFKFYKRFSLQAGSRQERLLNELLKKEELSIYLQHYKKLLIHSTVQIE